MTTYAPGQDEARTVDIRQADFVARAAVPGLGNVVATNVVVGASGTPGLRFTINGLNLTTDNPAVVMTQTRQVDNQDGGLPDEFAVQIITTSAHSILCRILRIDVPRNTNGWGQNLRLDLFIVDSVANP